jgi:hypothetical protein
MRHDTWAITALVIEGDTFVVDLDYQGQPLSIAADIAFEGRVAWITGGHVSSTGRNGTGNAVLMSLVRWAMDYLDVDEIRIAGATRTTGARPGRIPPVLAFGRDGSRRIGG